MILCLRSIATLGVTGLVHYERMISSFVFPVATILLALVKLLRKPFMFFCDASFDAMGFVIYLRSVSAEGVVHVAFVYGSSKISPRNTLSIPRLELCAALDASLSAFKVCEDLKIQRESVSLYSDSQVVLGYLFNKTKKFSRYVTRRVETILKTFSADQWQYVSTHENPGDIASRPQTFESLTESCWLKGPAFLWNPSLNEPTIPESVDGLELPETAETLSSFKSIKLNAPALFSFVITRVGSWPKLINVVNLVVIFIVRASESHVTKRKAICTQISR